MANNSLKRPDDDVTFMLGGETGTPISGPNLTGGSGNTQGTGNSGGKTGNGGNSVPDWLKGGGGVIGAIPDGYYKDADGVLHKKEEKKDEGSSGKKGGGGYGGLSNERKQRKPELAQQIADAYAAMNKTGAATWQDLWDPQIEAMRGDRYRDYESRYQPQMDNLMDRLLNREPFRYNWSDDPLYRQYAARYAQQARQGMQDTMGQAAALTGGYGSSYATAAGQQAYANQMAGLNDQAMQLYQLAKDRYDTEGQDMRSNLSGLTGLEQLNRQNYDTDRSMYYNRQDTDIKNLRDSQSLAYKIYQDQLARELQERQMAWDQYQYWTNLYEDKYLK